MGKKTALVVVTVLAILVQAARAQDMPNDDPAVQEPAVQESAVQEPADEDSAEREPANVGPAAGGGADTAGPESPQESLPRRVPARKDPFIAGVLSWFMMGIGQFYCREYTKGSLFMAADLVDRASLLLLIVHINNKYSPESGTAIINWGSFDDGTKILILAYLATSLGLRFYSVVDAIHSANDYNERVFSRRERSSLSFSYDRERFSLFYSIPLHD